MPPRGLQSKARNSRKPVNPRNPLMLCVKAEPPSPGKGSAQHKLRGWLWGRRNLRVSVDSSAATARHCICTQELRLLFGSVRASSYQVGYFAQRFTASNCARQRRSAPGRPRSAGPPQVLAVLGPPANRFKELSGLTIDMLCSDLRVTDQNSETGAAARKHWCDWCANATHDANSYLAHRQSMTAWSER